MKAKQQDLFKIDEMYGLIGVQDELDAIHINAYLWAISVVGELDEEQFQNAMKECEEARNEEGLYYIPSIQGYINIFKLFALRECLCRRENIVRPKISDPHSFEMAKKAYQKYFPDEYREKGLWTENNISILPHDINELYGR